MSENRFPWKAFMQLGMGRLRLSPEQFWRSTMRELVSAGGVSSPAAPLLRQSLIDLMEIYPDG
jgi:uncharacterized phage protein (TIGR02216 family)